MFDVIRDLLRFAEKHTIAAIALTALLVVGIALTALLMVIQKLP